MKELLPYFIGMTIVVRMSIPIGPYVRVPKGNKWQNGIFHAKLDYVLTDGRTTFGFVFETQYGDILKEVSMDNIYEIIEIMV